MNNEPATMDKTVADEEENQPLFFPQSNRPSFGTDQNNVSSTPARAQPTFARNNRSIFPTDISDRPLFGVSNRRSDDGAERLEVGPNAKVEAETTSSKSDGGAEHLEVGQNDEVKAKTTSSKDRIINLVVGCITGLLFLITLICAFCAPKPGGYWPPSALHVYFAVCILFIFIAHIILIHWYRQGDLDPKFRGLIYYNAFTMVLLSICALSYFFKTA